MSSNPLRRLVVVSALLLSACAQPTVQPITPSAHSENVHPVMHDPDAAPEGFVGIVVAPETVDVTTQLEARIRSIDVRLGDHVKAGALLAKLDTRSARHDLEMARAELVAARTERERAGIELAEAAEKLERRGTKVTVRGEAVGTVSDEELSDSKYQEKLAAVRVAAADASIDSKQVRLEQLAALVAEGAVRAPFDGTITARYIDAGAMLQRGAPIVRIIESGQLRVRFAVPEGRASTMKVGVPVRIVVDGRALGGTVEKVSPEIDASARMLFVEARLDADREQGVRPGQVARVSVATLSAEK
ncbi:MAG TPA: efflux RND transporter periplasmic adaptor subunit [Polyangia bacterium]